MMPVYDMVCEEHGYFEDVVCRIAERHRQACPECGEFLRILPPVVALTGYSESKPFHVEQIGRTFTSNAQLRQYQRENPDAKFVTPDERRRHYDAVREKCERSARRQGFTDLEHRRKAHRKAKQTGKTLQETA